MEFYTYYACPFFYIYTIPEQMKQNIRISKSIPAIHKHMKLYYSSKTMLSLDACHMKLYPSHLSQLYERHVVQKADCG